MMISFRLLQVGLFKDGVELGILVIERGSYVGSLFYVGCREGKWIFDLFWLRPLWFKWLGWKK